MSDMLGEAFWDKVAKAGPDDCWPWLGSKTDRGYGGWKRNGRFFRASRLVLQAKLGRELQRHEFACHACDNPSCVNPLHLWLGDNAANVADMVRKGRSLKGRRSGEDNLHSKLTQGEVRQIRALGGTMTQARIAERFGVAQPTVSDILTGKRWPDVR